MGERFRGVRVVGLLEDCRSLAPGFGGCFRVACSPVRLTGRNQCDSFQMPVAAFAEDPDSALVTGCRTGIAAKVEMRVAEGVPYMTFVGSVADLPKEPQRGVAASDCLLVAAGQGQRPGDLSQPLASPQVSPAERDNVPRTARPVAPGP